MRILVCEYLTAGGLYREPIPPMLVKEAVLMRDAMLDAMRCISGMRIFTTHDDRVPSPGHVDSCHVLQGDDLPWQEWALLMAEVDLVWLVAPESAGVLLQMTALVESSGKMLLSSTSSAVEVASSKWQTFQHLHRAGVAVVETTRAPAYPAAPQGWVVKPDDGVSCDGARYFHEVAALECWLSDMPADYIIQPYVEGQAASLTMLCRDGKAWLLACNQQIVEFDQGEIAYRGGVVNGLVEQWQGFEQVARQVAAAIPGLFGYVGVDLIVGLDGRLHVLEVNPRLTTSFAGLQAAMAYNPARLLLDLLYNADFTLPAELQRNRIEINLND
ncbi:ATP-grasp domain-containing protein [Methylobacillus methanolivorans]|uniref:ATP-grasp domain-containing protein n=1 Tax=Methylobacillus methanolivorans TaxID=1848927 RepID=A0ABW8GJN0_9PROT